MSYVLIHSVASFEVNDGDKIFLERHWQGRVVHRSANTSDDATRSSSRQPRSLVPSSYAVTSLLASYGSGSSSDEGESCCSSSDSERSDDCEQEEIQATTTTDKENDRQSLNSDRQLMVAITLDRIHCRIGNRLYQRLYDNHPSIHDSRASKTSFELINDTVPIEEADEF